MSTNTLPDQVLSAQVEPKRRKGAGGGRPGANKKTSVFRRMAACWQLYVMLVPPIAWTIVFLYWPLYGIQIAFKNFSVALGITGSPWAGMQYFSEFIHSYQFWPIIRNTLILNIYELVALFPLPVILALLLNAARSRFYSRGVQLITYAPHFISTVVVVGILVMLLDPNGGLVNQIIGSFGVKPIDFLGNPSYFRHVYVWSGAWQTLGYSAIIYLAALAGIDPQLHEAAKVDGANIMRRIWHIDLPGILPVTITLLVLNMGSVLSTGFEKVLLMQNNLNLSVSQVIDTYVYQVGFQSSIPQFSYGTAIGVFKSVIALTLLLLANWAARRVAKVGLW
jgi:multiple sugar transport system permease protein/putative aldouronate transport system permease protein